jgi:hypothetical protein
LAKQFDSGSYWYKITATLHGREEKKHAYKISVGKPVGKRPLERSRSRWENNTKIDLKV